MKGVMLNRDGGATLIVVLLLLLSVSLLGVSSLKTGIFNQRMAGNAQTDVSALEAAESAINEVLTQAQGHIENGVFFENVMLYGEQVNCIGSQGIVETHGYCAEGDDFGLSSSGANTSLGGLQSYAITKRKGRLPVNGYDIDQFSFHVFDTTGVGLYTGKASRYAYANTQRWKRFGASAEFDSFLSK